MKYRWHLLIGLLLGVCLLTGCQSKPAASSELAPDAGCRFGVCIKDVYVTMDGEYWMVLFDLTPEEGIASLDSAPMFSNTVQITIKSDQGTAYLDHSFTPEEYYCYSGTDIPWALGENTAACGIGNPVSADEKAPAVGDELIVSLPEFGDFETRVTVISGW